MRMQICLFADRLFYIYNQIRCRTLGDACSRIRSGLAVMVVSPGAPVSLLLLLLLLVACGGLSALRFTLDAQPI